MSIDSLAAIPATARTDSIPQASKINVNNASPNKERVAEYTPPPEKSASARESYSRDEITNAVSRLEKFVAPNQSDINFTLDESSGLQIVKIVDRKTQEIIRQMPSEDAVALAQALDKLQGLLIKDKA